MKRWRITFLPRQLFGEYVRQRLFDSVARRPDVTFSVVTAAARSVSSESGRYRIDLDKAEPVSADVVILATAYGLQQPRSQGPWRHSRSFPRSGPLRQARWC
jgi:uncharacterized NAD(P)/FAD-binding protein YdhS